MQPTATVVRGLPGLPVSLHIRFDTPRRDRESECSVLLTRGCCTDAIPKKRGPKTDVLEALVKRVNQMERALEAEGKAIPPQEEVLIETDSPIQKEADPIKNTATQNPPKTSPSVSTSNGDVEQQQQQQQQQQPHPQEPPQRRHQSMSFPDQALR